MILLPLVLAAAFQSEKPRETVLPEKGVHVPFELAATRAIPVVRAKVNGEGPFAFIFDTGAGGIVLDEEFVKSLGLELGAEQEIGDPSAAKKLVAHEVAVDSIEVGEARYRGVTAVAMDRKRFDPGLDLKGVLGLPLFGEHLFTLDYPGKEIVLAKGELPDPKAGPEDGPKNGWKDGVFVVAYDDQGELPRIELRLDEKTILAHVDSGSPSGWSFPKAFLEGAAWKEEPKVIGRGRTVNNEFEIWSGRLAGALKLGPMEVKEPVVSFNDQFPFANVGYRALKEYAITFDQMNHRMRFERKGER